MIEAIEVDDFSACGGDFYARGHLRTLAPGPRGRRRRRSLETYDERYADAPIDPRRVFEAELAGAGSIRATRGGPNWSVLVAAVMALILCWSVARLVTGGPDQRRRPGRAQRLRRAQPPTHAAGRPIRSRSSVDARPAGERGSWSVTAPGKVVFSGDLAYGQRHTAPGVPAGADPVDRRVGDGDGGGPGPRAHGARGPTGHRSPTSYAGEVAHPAAESGPHGHGAAYSTPMTTTHRDVSVALVTLGCARNDVDSEELAGRLAADGFRLVDDPEDAETVVVNTCGFVEAAKKDSVDTLLAAADLKEAGRTQAVVAVGCLAERYGKDLAESLPEADAVLGLRRLPRHRGPAALDPGRRGAAPAHPARPPQAAADHAGRPRRLDPVGARAHGPQLDDARRVGAPASGPRAVRRRLDGGPMAPLKLASGCDRRCSFCAIPSFRGSFVSRRPSDVARRGPLAGRRGRRASCSWSARTPRRTARTSATSGCSRRCCPSSPAVDGIERVRVSYLQPAETRPGPGRGDRDDAGRQRLLRPVLPARQRRRCCGGCAGSATPRASSGCSTRSAPSPRAPASAPT